MQPDRLALARHPRPLADVTIRALRLDPADRADRLAAVLMLRRGLCRPAARLAAWRILHPTRRARHAP